MEHYVIMWLYVWGAVATGALAMFANVTFDNERRPAGCFFYAVLWPVMMPFIASRWLLTRATTPAKSVRQQRNTT